jgi:hypothetical protein
MGQDQSDWDARRRAHRPPFSDAQILQELATVIEGLNEIIGEQRVALPASVEHRG